MLFCLAPFAVFITSELKFHKLYPCSGDLVRIRMRVTISYKDERGPNRAADLEFSFCPPRGWSVSSSARPISAVPYRTVRIYGQRVSLVCAESPEFGNGRSIRVWISAGLDWTVCR